MRALAIAVALAASACFAPDIPSGTVPCGPRGECPADFTCANGFCSNGGAPDAPLILPADAPPAIDGALADTVLPPPDAAPDAGPTAKLTIQILGAGGGQVTVNGRSCISTCTLAFPLGTPVSLTEAPSGNSSFGGWGGVCSGSGACTATLDADQTVTATFNPNTVQVTLQTSVLPLGTGTVTLVPTGTSCGTGCALFPSGSTVTLTATPAAGLSFIAWMGGGCNAQTGPCVLQLGANTTVVAQFCDANYVVDPTGADTNAGTCVAPLRTVTKALTLATSGQKVAVRPGIYSAAAGETFPLIVPAGVKLIGDEPAQGNGAAAVSLQGGSFAPGPPVIHVAVVVAKGATVAGFQIKNDAGTGIAAIDVAGVAPDGAVIRANTIANCQMEGVYLFHGSGLSVKGNAISGNGDDGVRIDTAGAAVEGNVVTANGYGVEANAGADLGGGGASSGGNVLACNKHNDVLAAAGVTVSASNDQWDHAPPSPGCSDGDDVCAAQGATVTTDGAALAGPCP